MIQITDLPTVFVRKLLGYFDWQTKLQLAIAIPSWSPALESRDAWSYVSNVPDGRPSFKWIQSDDSLSSIPVVSPDDEFNLAVGDDRFRDCLRQYGQYFRSCTLELQMEDVYMCRMDQTLLSLVLGHCHSLEHLVIHFPNGLGFRILQCLGDYRFMLNRLPKACPKIRRVAIRIRNYKPVMETSGIEELFEVADPNGLVPKLSELEFSYSITQHADHHFLRHFKRLTTLRTMEYSLNQDILIAIFKNGLKDLFISNDSLATDFDLESHAFADGLDWIDIANRFPKARVHYFYSYAQVYPTTFAENPLLRILVFDKLFNFLTPESLEVLGKCFPDLRVFAQLTSDWSFHDLHFEAVECGTMYSSYLLAHTPKLEMFMTCLTICSSDLLAMIETMPSLTTVVVNRDKIFYDHDFGSDRAVYLDMRMSGHLGDGWKPLTGDDFPEQSPMILERYVT